MLKYNNTHIFTGYLKQLLSTFSLPACRVYTTEFAEYRKQHGKEDPRVLESFDNHNEERAAVRINYLRNNELYHYFWKPTTEADSGLSKATWRPSASLHYDSEKTVPGLTRNLNSPGINYDTKTHEYLGDYLRFLRDYHNINLMSLYNCFNDKIYNNIDFTFTLNSTQAKEKQIKVNFNSRDPRYRLYAFPVKLFSQYTIAVDCAQGLEMFCGLYNATLDGSTEAIKLAENTYQKVHKSLFKQPFLYDKLNVKYWSTADDLTSDGSNVNFITTRYTRWDIANREKDLKLFIKVPISCESSIAILEGDYRAYNDSKFAPIENKLVYQANRSIINFNTIKNGDGIDLNSYAFKPISKLQLLALNTGESYPFADRLIEYLSGSAITPIDEIPDNIKRVQRVMKQNNHYFKIEGLWENKMQNILYDYVINSGPVEVENGQLVDRHRGIYRKLGYTSKSNLYDILGYVDKDTEKWYASWKKDGNNATVGTNLQSVDIYDGLYDLE